MLAKELREVRVVDTVRMFKSNFKGGVWVEGEVHHLWTYWYGVGKCKYCFWPWTVCNLRMRVCSTINLFVLLEKSPFIYL